MTTSSTPTPTSTSGESRQSLLARVRAALNKPAAAPPEESAPAVDASIARLASADDDLPNLFTQRAAAVGMIVHRTTAAQHHAQLLAILRDHAAQSVVLATADPADQQRLQTTLAQADIGTIDWAAAAGLDAQFDADAGLTDVHAALAETGTLICTSSARHSRGPSLVPPLHIALVRRSDILPDMIDFWARFQGKTNTELPSSIAFITGPSKTADIEGELIQGVHGPGHVHILLIEDA